MNLGRQKFANGEKITQKRTKTETLILQGNTFNVTSFLRSRLSWAQPRPQAGVCDYPQPRPRHQGQGQAGRQGGGQVPVPDAAGGRCGEEAEEDRHEECLLPRPSEDISG